MVDRESPSPDTVAAEQRDAEAEHVPDRPATPEEEKSAEEMADKLGEKELSRAARQYQELADIGAEIPGEGQIP